MDRKLGRIIAASLVFASAASFAQQKNWNPDYRMDEMSDRASCNVSALHDSSLMVWVDKGGVSFFISGDQYPGSFGSIRVDKNTAFRVEEDTVLAGKSAQNLLKQIRIGSIIKTRYIKWPSQRFEDRETEIAGLPEAIDECKALMKGG